MSKNELCLYIIDLLRKEEERKRNLLIDARVKYFGNVAMSEEWKRQTENELCFNNPYDPEKFKSYLETTEKNYENAKEVLSFATDTFLKMIV